MIQYHSVSFYGVMVGISHPEIQEEQIEFVRIQASKTEEEREAERLARMTPEQRRALEILEAMREGGVERN